MGALIRSFHFGLLVSWFALTLGVWWVAANSFQALNAEKNPAVSKLFASSSATKQKGRLAAREVNSRIFRTWNRLQLIFGVFLLLLVRRTGRMRSVSVLLGGCLLLIVCMHVFWFSPKIEALGKALASTEASGVAPAVKSAFGRYHGAYLITDVLKACLLFGAMWIFHGSKPWEVRH